MFGAIWPGSSYPAQGAVGGTVPPAPVRFRPDLELTMNLQRALGVTVEMRSRVNITEKLSQTISFILDITEN